MCPGPSRTLKSRFNLHECSLCATSALLITHTEPGLKRLAVLHCRSKRERVRRVPRSLLLLCALRVDRALNSNF